MSDGYKEPKSQRKVFVGGLNLKTTEESFNEYFSKFGELVDSVVMSDPYTKKSRGFGFLEFATAAAVEACQAARPHVVDGKEVESKRAVPREKFSNPEAGQSVKKVFVGGLRDLEEDQLREYFGQFGQCTSVAVMTDKQTGKKRGFGFIEFEDYDTVDRIVLQGEHVVEGTRIEVRKAVDKKEMDGRGGGMRGGRGGGRGRGDYAGGYGGGYGGGQGGFGGGQAAYGGSYGGNQGGYGGYGGGNNSYGGEESYGGGYGAEAGGYGGAAAGGGYGGAASAGGYGGYSEGGFGGGYGAQQGAGGGYGTGGFGGGPMRSAGGQGGMRGGRGSPYTAGGRGRGR